MAVRGAVFRENRFAEGVEIGTETEFTMRTEASGHRCWHFHASPVGHIIRPYQFKYEWLARRAYEHGRGHAMISHIIDKEAVGQSLYRTVRVIKGAGHVTMAACNVARSCLLSDADDHLKAFLRLQYRRGDFAERRALAEAYWRSARKRQANHP